MLNQQDIATHLDLSQPAVSGLMASLGIDWKATSLDEIRVAYIRHLREQAAGRAASGDLVLATERAALARAQREKVEMQNAVTRRELAPVSLLEEVLAKCGRQIAAILEAIPVGLKRRSAITVEDLEFIASEIVKARNVAASIGLEALDIGGDESADELMESGD